MLNSADVQKLRQQGQSNRQILEMMAPVVPSARRALDQIDADKVTPDWQRETKIGQMLDKHVPKNAPSGLTYLTAIGLNHAQQKFDEKNAKISEPVVPLGQQNPQQAAQGPSMMPMQDYMTDVFKGAGQDINAAASGVNEAVSNYQEGRQGFGSTLLQTTGHLAGGAANVLSEPIKPVVQSFIDLLGALKPEGENPFNPFKGEKSPELVNKFNDWAVAHPEAAANLQGVLQTASLPLAMVGAEKTIQGVGQGVENLGRGVVEPVQQFGARGGIAGMQYNKMTPQELEQAILNGEKVPVNIMAKHPDIFAKYSGVKGATAEEAAKMMDAGADLPEINAKTLEGQRVKLLKDAGLESQGNLSFDPNSPEGQKIIADAMKKIPASKEVQQAVQPDYTTKELTNIRAKSPERITEPTFLKKGSIAPSAGEAELAKTAAKIDGFEAAKTPIAKAKIVKDSLIDDSDNLRMHLRVSNAALPKQEIQARVNAALTEQAKYFPGEEKIFSQMSEYADDIMKNQPGNLEGAWNGRIELYNKAADRWGDAIFDKNTAKAQALRSAAQTINETIEEAAQRAGTSFAKEIGIISHKYDILENLATQGRSGALNSGLQKLLKNPFVKGAATLGGGGAVLKAAGAF